MFTAIVNATVAAFDLTSINADTDVNTILDHVADPRNDLKGIKFTTAQLIAFVKAHALAFYNNPYGWDFVIETMEDGDIAEIIGTTTSRNVAIERVRKAVHPMASFRRECIASGQY